MALVIGAPIPVPDTDDATVEAKRLELERALGTLEARARALLTGAPA
jgi:hypothetical protein